jgi:hypothetical protein
MATFRLRRFSSPSTLKAIAPNRLLTFLEPYGSFFKSRGLVLPTRGSCGEPDYGKLIAVFMSPDDNTPKELIDALFFVDEMATEKGMEDLLDASIEVGLSLDTQEDVSPADLAIQVWLRDPDLLERKHAEQFLYKPRSFEYYQTDEANPPPFRHPGTATLGALEQALNHWFEQRKRGRTAKVFVFDRPGAVWFMVRHGEPFKREESVEGTEPSSVSFRPLRHDVLVYDSEHGELRINAQLAGEKELYRREFGKHLFGRADFFPNAEKYTLDPIRRDGEKCVHCQDIVGMEWVVLREVHLAWGGPHAEYEIRKANNLFEALKNRGNRSLPTSPRLVRAVFQVKFRDAKRPRSVTLRPPNVALFVRDEDSVLIDEWLQKRGFLDVQSDTDREAAGPFLAGA